MKILHSKEIKGPRGRCERQLKAYKYQLVRLVGCQPAVFFSHIKSAPATSHLPASSIFLSQQISTSHQLAEQADVGRFVCNDKSHGEW
jgi:hypothetical protein